MARTVTVYYETWPFVVSCNDQHFAIEHDPSRNLIECFHSMVIITTNNHSYVNVDQRVNTPGHESHMTLKTTEGFSSHV